jgi:hypothetical protein
VSDPSCTVAFMSTTDVYLVKSCAHCGDGCDAREHECAECRFYYCEAHVDPQTHDCHTVCVELKRHELDEEEERRTPQLRLVF